jgi:sulfide dehydrogenase [flavocytochrome c] flavoprotein chain
MKLQRRDMLKFAGLAGVAGSGALVGCAMNTLGTPDKARVLVVGGGFGGATAAKYVRLLSNAKRLSSRARCRTWCSAAAACSPS